MKRQRASRKPVSGQRTRSASERKLPTPRQPASRPSKRRLHARSSPDWKSRTPPARRRSKLAQLRPKSLRPVSAHLSGLGPRWLERAPALVLVVVLVLPSVLRAYRMLSLSGG